MPAAEQDTTTPDGEQPPSAVLTNVPAHAISSARHVHQALIVVAGPSVVVSTPDGQIGTSGNSGFYREDRRLLNTLALRVLDTEPDPVAARLLDASTARFVGVVRHTGEDRPDPTIIVERTRSAADAREEITIRNTGRTALEMPVRVRLGTDLAEVSAVSADQGGEPLPAAADGAGLRWTAPDGTAVTVAAEPAPHAVDPASGTLHWTVRLEPHSTARIDLRAEVRRPAGTAPTVLAPSASAPWSRPEVHSPDNALGALVHTGLGELAALLLADPADPADVFLAAGAPWYLTLFGRDSIWAARMLLPLGTELAAGTLRALARRQGTRHNAVADEAPGKILHEIRPADRAVDPQHTFPAQYYGTVDATPLFVTLLGEAARWGMPESEVAALVPAVERALGWITDDGDADGDGFLEYIRNIPGGLANQGWKDSVDAVQFADGRLAEAPIVLSEVQGYAYQAARHGADLLDRFGRGGGEKYREWAAGLRERFRDRFWINDPAGPYPAIALDRDKRPVDGPASNMGHLLGTGILDDAECALVADRLGASDMDSGWGLRTRSSTAAGYNPFGYHGGTVWAHDTAIAVAGLAATGHPRTATALADGLLAVAGHVGHRLPELHAGVERRGDEPPLPYPAACHPQAWAAAAGVSLVASALGLDPDVPGGTLTVRPTAERLDVRGLRLGGRPLDVRVQDGEVTVHSDLPGLDVRISPAASTG